MSSALIIFGYGVIVGKYQVFPYQILNLAVDGYKEIRGNDKVPWYYREVRQPAPPSITNTDQAYDGLNLVVQIAAGRSLSAKIIDMEGNTLNEWDLDWFKIWPDAEHLSDWRMPKSKPGTFVHGAIVMENGDLVFNYEHLGMVRLNPKGNVVWRLPYQTHHSIHRAENGNLWVSGQKEHTIPDARFPERLPPFDEYMIVEVTPNGKIVQEWSVPELLRLSSSPGLLYMGGLVKGSDIMEGDVLHLNDVEPFPDHLDEGFFKKGDVLVSLRDINTVFVFNRYSNEIKFMCTGWFVRQHDPDFIDGDRFSVFDNNNIAPEENGPQSRIVIVSAVSNSYEVIFEGSPDVPFYTYLGGKHQWLPNGNLLITEFIEGRAFEVNKRGEIVWEYVNYVEEGMVGLLSEVQRLPSDYSKFYNSSVSD